ncbi:MAG: secretin N-terminal domain-containing protein [Verrucomicrobiota bacterium]|jgi:type II secretion system protein D
MQTSKRRKLKITFILVMLSLCLAAVFLWCTLPFVHAQSGEKGAGTNAASSAPVANSTAAPPGAASPAPPAATNPASAGAANPAPRASTDTNPPATAAGSTNGADGSTNAPPDGAVVEARKLPTDLIPLSLQNMQIDQVLQWLAENTGKSVVKHPTAHCQITIVSTKKVTRREAVTMVYRALGMEGFTAIETGTSILIVPADQELKMNLSPELMGAADTAVPGGRQRLVKVFPLLHLPVADLTEKVKSVLSKEAVVVTDDRANLMVVTDYNDNLAAATGLINALDVEKNDDVIVRVVNLKNVNALELSKQIQPLYQKLTGKQSKELIEVSASDNANSLMVLSSAANFREIEKFATSLDTADAQETMMKTFELKNADAQDVAKQLQDLGKNQQGDNDSGYRILYLGGNPNGKDTKKISIVADRRRNAILVQAPPAAMEGIGKTIAALDQPIQDNSLAPQIIHLENVSAGDIEDVLNELFLKKTTARSYYDYIFGSEQETDRDVGRLYGKVRITSEAAANALIITANSQENLDAVIAVVKELDKPSAAGDTTFHVKLNFGNAQKIANRINILFAKNGSVALRQANQPNQNAANTQPQQQQTQQTTPSADDFSLEQVVKEDPYYSWLGGPPDASERNGSSDRITERPVSDLVGRVRVVPDEAASSLLVTANIHLFAQVSKMIQDMDVPPAQVLIAAKLVQVSADYLDQIGVRFSPDGGQVFSGADYQNSLMPHAGGTYLKGFGNNTQVNNPINPGGSGLAAPVGQALASLRSGVLDNTMSMDFLIQFLHENADATVISEPQITISDNDMGKLFVGQSVPIGTGSVNPALGGSSQTITYRNVGVIVEVEPHINDSGDVQLRIRTESSTIEPTQINSNVVIDAAQFRTELTAKAGETLVLGGIIQKQLSDTTYKTPILGSIPLLKYAFSKRDKSVKRTELLVFLRPKVVRSPEQARQLLEELSKKMPLIQKSEQNAPEAGPEPADNPAGRKKE